MNFFSLKKPEFSGQQTRGKVKKNCYPGFRLPPSSALGSTGCAMRCGRRPVVPTADVRAGKARG